MIHYIKGKMAARLASGIVIEAGGIGYEISVPSGSSLYLTQTGEEVKAFIAMIVNDDGISLYGFPTESSLTLFRQLITVNSVGAKAAMSILSSIPDDKLKKAILFEDAATISSAKGVGKKTAQKIVLELKDKIDDTEFSGQGTAGEDIGMAEDDERAEAVDALVSLGYSRSEAAEALVGVHDDAMTAEDYIKLALKKI